MSSSRIDLISYASPHPSPYRTVNRPYVKLPLPTMSVFIHYPLIFFLFLLFTEYYAYLPLFVTYLTSESCGIVISRPL